MNTVSIPSEIYSFSLSTITPWHQMASALLRLLAYAILAIPKNEMAHKLREWEKLRQKTLPLDQSQCEHLMDTSSLSHVFQQTHYAREVQYWAAASNE